jgi:hypothetical protein
MDGTKAAYDMSRSDYANPADLFPGPCGASAYPLDAGTSVLATSGLGQRGDTFGLDQRPDYRVENLLVELVASPRRRWRSTVTTETTIALQMHATADERTQRDVLLCALWGINFRRAYLDGWDGATWTELADMDIGIKALGTCPMRTVKRGEGLRDAPVAFGGVVFVPGDILHADADGLAVLPVDEEDG